MNEPLWYWIVTAIVVAIFVGVPLAYWLEGRAEKRDQQAWREFNRIGGRR